MAFSDMKVVSALAVVLVVVLPVVIATDAKWDDVVRDNHIPPTLSPYIDNICSGVNCGKGRCEEAAGEEPFNFKCICDPGWKHTSFDHQDDDDDLHFLPCVIPNCSLNYSCMPAAPPAPAVSNNKTFFDPCNWMYCGEGRCMRNSSTNNNSSLYVCECKPGVNNLLNISTFPCYSDCALGSDCESLGVRVSRSATDVSSDNHNQAMAFKPGKFHYWAALLMMITATMAHWM